MKIALLGISLLFATGAQAHDYQGSFFDKLLEQKSFQRVSGDEKNCPEKLEIIDDSLGPDESIKIGSIVGIPGEKLIKRNSLSIRTKASRTRIESLLKIRLESDLSHYITSNLYKEKFYYSYKRVHVNEKTVIRKKGTGFTISQEKFVNDYMANKNERESLKCEYQAL